MGQWCCAGYQREREADALDKMSDDWNGDHIHEYPPDTSTEDTMEGYDINTREHYDCTECDPLLPKKTPRAYCLQPTPQPMHDHLEEGDANRRTPEIPIPPSARHDGDPYSLEKLARRDAHAVQLEPYPPGPSHEVPYTSTLHHGAQERDPHDLVQDHSPVDPRLSLKHTIDNLAPSVLQPEPRMIHSYDEALHRHRDVNVTEMHTPAVNLHTPLASVGSKQIEHDGMSDAMSSLLKKIEIKSNTISGSCDHNGGILTSKEGSLKLTIPEGAIKQGEWIDLYIATDLYGPFKLPSGCQATLASPYYCIEVTGSYQFHKPVLVEFEHFAVVTACDPSHYQLFCCEDDDKSFIMQPVDCSLMLDGSSWCTFNTYHFCSYCLFHNCEHPMINRIGIFFLKPKHFQVLNHFALEVWFSFPLKYCMERNEELYTRQGMVLDSDCSGIFEASSDRNSTSYFIINYSQKNDGWSISHIRFDKIETKEVNFYNYYTNMNELKAIEERSLFPPRFIVNVAKKAENNMELNASILIT